MKYIIVLLISFHFVSVFSQHYPLTTLNFDDGLTRASFYEVAKDPQGYMWLASETSIIRYDGTEFKQYSNADGIKGNFVLDIDFDENNNMWISTYGGGVARFDGTRFWSFNTENGFPGNYIRSAFRSSSGDWWVSSEEAGPIWVPKNKKPIVMNEKLGINIMNPWSMYEDKKGDVWVAAIGGLGKFVKKEQYKYKVIYSTLYTLTSIVEDKDGNILAAGAYTFIKVVNDSVINLGHTIPVGSIFFDMMISSKDEKLYLAGADKLMVSHKDTFEYLDKSNGIANAQFWDVYEDETHSIWLSSAGGGVLKYDNKGIAWYGGEGDLHFESSIQDIVEDNQGRIIFGTELNGYFYYHGGEFHKFSQPEISSIVTGYALDYHSLYDLIVFTSPNGSVVWLRGDKVVGNYKSERAGGKTIYGMKILDSNQVIYATDVGCYTLHRDSVHPHLITSIPETFFRSVFLDADGYAWFAGDNGDIYKYKDGKAQNYQPEINPQRASVLTGYYDEYYGYYFFCTNIGLIVWDGKNKMVITNENGLMGDVPNAVIRDHENKIWIAHDKGFTIFDPKTKESRHIGYDQGFRSVSVNFRSLLMSKSGNIFAGSVNELYKIDPDELEPDNLHTILRLQKVSFRDKVYFEENYYTDSLPQLNLQHNENNFQFDLAALDFVNANKVKYSWRLDGFDDDFMPYAYLSEVSYTNLPPGDYEFIAKAIDSEGFETNEVRMKIVIEKPVWEKLWFYALEISIFIVIAVMSFILSGKKSDNRFGQVMTFLTIIIFFESAIFYLSNFINPLTNGIPVFQLVMNIILAAVLQPMEQLVKKLITSRKG